jgi:hypothetical protein
MVLGAVDAETALVPDIPTRVRNVPATMNNAGR